MITQGQKRSTTGNTQYSQWRGKLQFETFCPASKFVTVDSDEARKPPLAILPNVMGHYNNTMTNY